MIDERPELMRLAEGIVKQAEKLSRILEAQVPAPIGGGSSPVIISDGSLYIASIFDSIAGPTGNGPYSYLIEKHSPLIVARHCGDGGFTKPTNGDNWQLTIPLTSGGGPIVVTQADALHIQITGVPSSYQPSNAAEPGENVIIMNVTPDWPNATFVPDTANPKPKAVGRHLSLHFSKHD